MYKVTLTAAVAACALLCANQAAADEAAAPAAGKSWYEVGVSQASVPELDTSYNVLTGRIGTKFSKHFGTELELGVGLNKDTVEFLSVDVDTKLDYNFGAFITGELPVSDNVALTGRLGYARAQFTVSAGGNDESAETKGVAYGVGFKITDKSGKNGLRVEFTRQDDNEDTTDFISATFVRSF